MSKRMDDMNNRLNILTGAIIMQTIAIAGLIVTVLLQANAISVDNQTNLGANTKRDLGGWGL